MNRIVKLIILFNIIYINIIYSATISRNDVINTALAYVHIGEWTPKVDSTDALSPTWHSLWYKTKANGGNPPYDKLAYCWAGFDSPWLFNDRVERENNPLPAGGQGTSKYGLIARDYIAGIDCAGFVLRCWGISYYSTWGQLKNYSIGIEPSKLKQGDWLRVVGKHQLLYESGDIKSPNVYESTSDYHVDTYNNNHYPGVQHNYNRNLHKAFYPYSIFPQFSVLNLVKELG